MRLALALPTICLLMAATPAASGTAWARSTAHRPVAKPAAAALPPAVVAAAKAVEAQEHARTFVAYPDALMALARAYSAAGRLPDAYRAAQDAAAVYDEQLELRHGLSEALTDPIHGRAERTAARKLGLARDDARFYAAQLAERQGDKGAAVTDYVLVVRSQPGEGQGIEAMAALKALGWLASPAPSLAGTP